MANHIFIWNSSRTCVGREKTVNEMAKEKKKKFGFKWYEIKQNTEKNRTQKKEVKEHYYYKNEIWFGYMVWGKNIQARGFIPHKYMQILINLCKSANV